MPRAEIKLYFDYKSPFAYLAKDPAYELEREFDVALRWIPYFLKLKGPGERSQASEWKAKYSYLDARRWANARSEPLTIRGPLKIYASEPALLGGLYAQEHGFFRPYTDLVYERFFKRELEIDRADGIAQAIDSIPARGGASGADYLDYASNDRGRAAYESCVAEAAADHVFGVPLFFFQGEPFWGHDRMPLLRDRLEAAGLKTPSR